MYTEHPTMLNVFFFSFSWLSAFSFLFSYIIAFIFTSPSPVDFSYQSNLLMQLTFAILLLLSLGKWNENPIDEENSFTFYSVPSIGSLQCYVCNSNEDASCAEGHDLNKFVQTCKETVQPYCRKIDQTGTRNSISIFL